MSSTSNAGDEPPSEDEDRGLLFRPEKEGREPGGRGEKPRRPSARASSPPRGTSPPATEAEAPSDAVLRRILSLLEELAEKRAGPAAGEADLAAAARTIAGQAEQIGAATEWVNDIKAAISELLASTGKQIDGLKSGNRDLDAALAQLIILKDRLDKVVSALDVTANGLDRRSSELKAVKQDLAGYYEAWTAESKTSRGEMKALSKRLDAGDHMVTRLERSIGPWTEQMEESIGANSAAQRAAAENTAGNVERFATTGSDFLKDFTTARGKALKEARQEWTRIRRWTLPFLAIALVLAAPLFVFAGAIGQSEFGVFDPYDDTHGWRRLVWERHGQQVQGCMLDSWRAKQVIPCKFDVRVSVIGAAGGSVFAAGS